MGKEKEKTCYFDDERGIMIHCFEPGRCLCKCKKKCVRRPVKRGQDPTIFIFGKVVDDV